MSFTEATLTAQLDPTGQGRTIVLEQYINNSQGTAGTSTDVYAVGVITPYAGRSRWVNVLQSNTAAQAAAVIQGALA